MFPKCQAYLVYRTLPTEAFQTHEHQKVSDARIGKCPFLFQNNNTS